MKTLKLFVGCALLAIAPSAFAGTFVTSAIQSVYPQDDGSFVIKLYTDSAACTSTNRPYKYYFVKAGQFGMTAEGVKMNYAAALFALGTGKQVIVAFDESTTCCYVNRLDVED